MEIHVAGAIAAMSLAVAGAEIRPASAADMSLALGEASGDLQPARDKIKAGDFAGAIPLLAAIVKDKPQNADALNLLGFSLRKTGKWGEALDYYNRALAVDPKHLGANEYLGELYVERGQVDKAKERLAVLEKACGKDCEETKDLSQAIQAGPAYGKK